MNIQLECISKESFIKYGSILEFDPNFHGEFSIIVEEADSPWRLAVFRFNNREIDRMERHPSSKESFEPLSGAAVLMVAEAETPEKFRAFFLDKPICLHKGIWHQVLSLTPEASVKITENLEVSAEFYNLEVPMTTVLAPIKQE